MSCCWRSFSNLFSARQELEERLGTYSEECPLGRPLGYLMDCIEIIGYILGLHRDNGKYHGNYYLGFRVYQAAWCRATGNRCWMSMLMADTRIWKHAM